MSYILDALRKADAERERGNVPSIHAQPSFAGASPTAAPRTLRPLAWAVAAAALVALIGAGLWAWRSGGDAAVPPPARSIGPTSTPMSAVPAAPAAPLPAPAMAPPAVAVTPPARVAAPAEPPSPPRKPAAPGPAKPVVAKAPTPAASTAVEPRVYAVNELPEDIRRQLPAFNIGGSMYSATPANRILIINGLVLHEGEKIAPELVLQQIGLKGAVLAFKGYHYSIAF